MTTPTAIIETAGQPSTTRVGTIVSVNPVRVDIQGTVFGGSAVGILGSYSPVVGDHVSVLGQSVRGASSSGSSWLILGRIAATRPLVAGMVVARLERAAASNLAPNSPVSWDTVAWDDLIGYDATLPTRYTPRYPGRWLFHATARHQPMTTPEDVPIAGALQRNGVTFGSANSTNNSSPSAGTTITVTSAQVFNGTTDYVELIIGSNQPVNVNNAGSVLIAVYGGPTP